MGKPHVCIQNFLTLLFRGAKRKLPWASDDFGGMLHTHNEDVTCTKTSNNQLKDETRFALWTVFFLSFSLCPAAHDSFRTGTVQRNFLPKRLTRLRCFTFDCFRSDLKMSLDNYAILLESSDPCSFCLLFGTYIVIFSHSNHSTLILPLCWRISYENLAILSIATASGGLHRPSFWQAVHDQIRTSVFEVIPSCCLKLLNLLQQWQKERWLWWLVIGFRKSVSIIRVYFKKKL